jgi:hypothetical protein
MSLNKIIKIASVEAGPILNNNPRLSFNIAANTGVYDLSKSYINVNCNVLSDNNVGIQIPQVSFDDDSGSSDISKAFNIALVKNSDWSCSRGGSISHIQRVDLLNNTLNNYKLTTEQQQSEDYFSLCDTYDVNQQLTSIFRTIYKQGREISRNIGGNVKIPLSQLSGFGLIPAYDSAVFGALDIKMELNLDKIRLTNYLGAATVTTPTNWSRRGMNLMQDLAVVAANPLWATTGVLFSDTKFRSIEESPYFVGQVLKVSFKSSASTPVPTTKAVVILSIKFLNTEAVDAQNGQIQLTLNAQTITDITCEGVDATFEFQVTGGEIVLEQVAGLKSGPSELEYLDWSTEINTNAAMQNLQKNFNSIEPNCLNLLVMNGGSFLSKKKNVESWRMSLNNKFLTNRAVEYASPLALDRLAMTFGNSQQKLNNVNEIFQSATTNQVGYDTIPDAYKDTNKLLVMCNPLPLTQEYKNIQLNINSGASDITEIVLYKELVKTLKV